MPAFPDSFVIEEAEEETAGATLDGPFQVELRGVHFGSCDCLDVQQLVVTDFLDGFGIPATRNSDDQRPMGHGLIPSPQFMDGRALTIAILARGDTNDDLHAAMVALGRAWAPVSPNDDDLVIPLAFTLEDAARRYVVWGKPTKAKFGYDHTALVSSDPLDYRFSDAALCEFLATDPRIYTLDASGATLTLGATTGGLGFPHGFPHGFGSSTTGAADCGNQGNIETFPIITVVAGAAGASGISLTNTTTGKSWAITTLLNPGEWLVVDMGARTAMLMGTADRSPFVIQPPSTWWPLEPGHNVINLAVSGGATASVMWRDAYLI